MRIKPYIEELRKEFLSSNISITQFCDKHNMSRSLFYKYKLNRDVNTTSEDFIDITNIVKPVISNIEIKIDNVSILVNDNTDLSLLKKVLKEIKDI